MTFLHDKKYELDRLVFGSSYTFPSLQITGSMFIRMATEKAAVDGVVTSILISTAFAVTSVLAFTGNAVVAILATTSLVVIVLTVLGTFSLAGWTLGIVEAVSITILVGLSCDFSLHLAEAFTKSKYALKNDRAKDAVAKVGKPVIAAGITTFAAVVPMLGCTIQVLNKFGAIIPACIVFSLFFSLHLFVPLLMVFGPNGSKNETGWLVGLPSFLFRTSARRTMFFLCTGTFFCLVVPSTRAIAKENLIVFVIVFFGLFLLIYAWLKVERSREETGDAIPDPTSPTGVGERLRTERDGTPSRVGLAFPQLDDADDKNDDDLIDQEFIASVSPKYAEYLSPYLASHPEVDELVLQKTHCGVCGEEHLAPGKFCAECGAKRV